MRSVMLLSIALLLAACSPAIQTPVMPTVEKTATPFIPFPTASPLPTASLTPAPTLTSTPVPTLTAHEWSQSEPLIMLTNGWGDGGPDFRYSLPVEFTLMPSGDLYLRRWKAGVDEIVTVQLPRQATCQLLNSVDQAGFFDYDPATYVKNENAWFRPIAGPDNTYIWVHAWRENSVSLFFLPGFMDPAQVAEMQSAWAGCSNCPEYPTILPAIRNTYLLIDHYQPPRDMQPLKPGRLGVWLYPDSDPLNPTAAIDWPLKSHTLAAAAALKGDPWDPPAMVLSGTDATRVYDALQKRLNLDGTEMREGKKLYRVFARPLLPNEYNPAPLPTVKLSCSPADGWMEAR